MKPFAFNMEKILKLRKYREDETKIELGRAIGVLAELEGKLRSLGNERARAAAAQFSPANSAAQMQQYMFYILRLDTTKEQLLKETALAEMKVEEARVLFIEASRERKVLDKLKEKRQKEYRKELLAEETKTLDDIPAKL
ncbi:MAG: flagellar export protein FliJ [Treponema sp.]|nr:flagellar export protein FliJ [Treponema sp.]